MVFFQCRGPLPIVAALLALLLTAKLSETAAADSQVRLGQVGGKSVRMRTPGLRYRKLPVAACLRRRPPVGLKRWRVRASVVRGQRPACERHSCVAAGGSVRVCAAGAVGGLRAVVGVHQWRCACRMGRGSRLQRKPTARRSWSLRMGLKQMVKRLQGLGSRWVPHAGRAASWQCS